MKKAVSETILMVMLLMIVATLAGVGFLFMTQFTEEAKSETGQTGAQSVKKIGSCLQMESFDENTNILKVKNCGRYPVDNVTVFIDGDPAFSEVLDIKPNEVKSILITASSAVHEIKIESAYASALILANVTNSCSDGTSHGECSSSKPKYCNAGMLVNKCSVCGCPLAYGCQADEICIEKIAPAAITNLAASDPTAASIKLAWTSPGDDENIGTASQYDIRYSTSPITDANWASATQATGEPAPAVGGTVQSFTVMGLNPTTTYYFVIKTADEVPNWSGLSNVPSGTTPAWYNVAWGYRKPVSIIGSILTLTNYQMLAVADTASLISAGKMRSDCGDIRLTDPDKTTLLSYWVESGCNSPNTRIWVKVPSIPISGTNVYIYYGNPSATSVSSATNVFGASAATSAIPGCVMGQACIVSSSQQISSSGIYGHPYVRIDSGVTLNVTIKNVYFNIPRLEVFGTIISDGGGGDGGSCNPGCSATACDGGAYYGGASGGAGGSAYYSGGNIGGGGGTDYSGGCNGVGGNYGAGGGVANCQGSVQNKGKGAFLSLNATTFVLKSSGSLQAIGKSGTNTGSPTGCCGSGGGGGSLIQILSSDSVLDGAIIAQAGGAYSCSNNGAGGGGSLIYLNYSGIVGTGSATAKAGDGSYTIARAGGTATIITPDGTQTGSASGVTGGSTSKTISVGYSEPSATIGAEEAK